jgi:hypothetical protein
MSPDNCTHLTHKNPGIRQRGSQEVRQSLRPGRGVKVLDSYVTDVIPRPFHRKLG